MLQNAQVSASEEEYSNSESSLGKRERPTSFDDQEDQYGSDDFDDGFENYNQTTGPIKLTKR